MCLHNMYICLSTDHSTRWQDKHIDGLLITVQFIWNFLRRDKKRWPLNTSNSLIKVTAEAGLSVHLFIVKSECLDINVSIWRINTFSFIFPWTMIKIDLKGDLLIQVWLYYWFSSQNIYLQGLTNNKYMYTKVCRITAYKWPIILW
jgi:hypothetical protein